MNLALFDKLKALPDVYGGLDAVQGDLMYLMGCGSFEQFAKTLRGLLDPVHYCPFCTDGRNGKTSMGWYLKPNDFRGKDMRAMLLIIPNRHIIDPRDLLPSDWTAMGMLFGEAIRQLGIAGGGLVMRFGDPRYHSGTIPHLHANVIAPTGETEYRIPLSKDDKSRRDNYVRLMLHRSELMDKGGLKYLFPSI